MSTNRLVEIGRLVIPGDNGDVAEIRNRGAAIRADHRIRGAIVAASDLKGRILTDPHLGPTEKVPKPVVSRLEPATVCSEYVVGDSTVILHGYLCRFFIERAASVTFPEIVAAFESVPVAPENVIVVFGGMPGPNTNIPFARLCVLPSRVTDVFPCSVCRDELNGPK